VTYKFRSPNPMNRRLKVNGAPKEFKTLRKKGSGLTMVIETLLDRAGKTSRKTYQTKENGILITPPSSARGTDLGLACLRE